MWLQNEASSPLLTVVHDRTMGAAVEEVQKNLRKARDAKDIGHSATALIRAIDALQDIDASRTIATRLAEEMLQIIESRAHQVSGARDNAVLAKLLRVSDDLLETGLADQDRLDALMGRMKDQMASGGAAGSSPAPAVQVLAWAYEKHRSWAQEYVEKYNRDQRKELAELWRDKLIYEIQALASIKGVGYGTIQKSLLKQKVGRQEQILADERVQRIARQSIKKECQGILNANRQHISFDDLLGG